MHFWDVPLTTVAVLLVGSCQFFCRIMSDKWITWFYFSTLAILKFVSEQRRKKHFKSEVIQKEICLNQFKKEPVLFHRWRSEQNNCSLKSLMWISCPSLFSTLWWAILWDHQWIVIWNLHNSDIFRLNLQIISAFIIWDPKMSKIYISKDENVLKIPYR